MSVCKICGKVFEGKGRASYCSAECRRKRNALNAQRYYYKKRMTANGATDEEINEKISQIGVAEAKLDVSEIKSNEVEFECLTTKEHLQEVGEIRELLKKFESVRNELFARYTKHINRFNEIEKEKVLYNHKMESNKDCPSDEYMIQFGKQLYSLVKERRIEQLFADRLFKIVGTIPKNVEKFFLDGIAYQDELNNKYEKTKEWNTDKWNIGKTRPKTGGSSWQKIGR